MRGQDWGPITSDDGSANTSANTLIVANLTATGYHKLWRNLTLPNYVASRANPQVVWRPVSQQGSRSDWRSEKPRRHLSLRSVLRTARAGCTFKTPRAMLPRAVVPPSAPLSFLRRMAVLTIFTFTAAKTDRMLPPPLTTMCTFFPCHRSCGSKPIPGALAIVAVDINASVSY
ncbi:hypothetical protein N7471_010398 [Penicillium samsonianum]|uniref:uncharacterized protein n=1 Tax=Penicillium samsonianum TaxID=1882272 RepID=UPI00254790F4|nr:uncharacterized protein N7471_010398 [Penicillium samsonianum]KAJ6125905.1 hypothetical protein N7471_010398 [Penicillium samsonianum]